jgi:RNA polymerase sigma-70 factor (ECF subfamily)
MKQEPVRKQVHKILMVEDSLLLWRFKNGSEDALCRIYEKYRSTLLKLAVALVNDTAAAEDIVQDVFVSFAQSGERLRVSGNLHGYLATSVANRVRNRYRAGQGQQKVGTDKGAGVPSDSKTPEQWASYSEELKKLNDALAQLPYEQREVILLHVHGAMRFRAIAQSQKVPLNTVQSRYRYGIEKLRSILDSEPDE